MPEPDVAVDLPALIADHASSGFSPSGMVAIAKRGEVVRFEPWGQDGYTPRSLFRVASCTKSFTALALLILRRAGRLSLDDEIALHLPELTTEADGAWPVLRLRHLMSMSGGLATDNPWGDRQESIGREQLAAWMKGGLRLMFAPGSAYEYSNLGYALLGEVITRVSGQDYRQFVQQRIIEPLALQDTKFAGNGPDSVVPSYHREPLLPGRPGGWARHEQSTPGAFSPMGGLYSSAHDMAAWANLFLERDVPGGVGFTPADLLEAQQTQCLIGSDRAEAPLGGLVTTSYGFGLKIERYAEHGKLVSHAGGYPGFTAYMCWHEESGHAVIASANGSHSAAPALARKVMLRLVAQEGPAAQSPAPWGETLTAVATLQDLVRSVGHLGAGALIERFQPVFAENVELDFPLARRVDYLQQALVSLGGVRPAGQADPPVCEQPCRARWHVPTELGRLELLIELMPVAPFAVQTFSAVAVRGSSRVLLF